MITQRRVIVKAWKETRSMRFTGAISLILLLAFVYIGWLAGFWLVVLTWTVQDWAAVLFMSGASWWLSNDFSGGRQG
jgi:hypothetical protein